MMEQASNSLPQGGKEIAEGVRSVLISLGRGLGTVSVYGIEHPSVNLIIDKTFEDLNAALQNRKSIAIGTFNGTLTVDEQPVVARDAPVRALEKRLAVMKISHLTLNRGLVRDELKKLLTALCSSSDIQMKETLSAAGMNHVEMADVKYVTLRNGEQKTGRGGYKGGNDSVSGADADSDKISSSKISQIVAFLNGGASGADSSGEVKKILSDPERLGQMIMEAAAIRQASVTMDGESLSDIVVGCLRRTYDGLKKEDEFQSSHGKATLAKTMLLLEKTIIDKIRRNSDPETPDLERRIQAGIREMEAERQLDVLSTHYAEQCQKRNLTEERIIDLIRKQGPEKAREQLAASNIPFSDWQRLMVQSGVSSSSGDPQTGAGGNADISVIATVLEKLGGLMQMANSNPEEAKAIIGDARRKIHNYTNRMELHIEEIEGKVHRRKNSAGMLESRAEHLDREKLILEISKLTLSLMQPLTVINGSIEAALTTANETLRKDLLDMAYQSGQSMQAMTKRMIALVGYPTLNEADGHLNEFKASL
jgi:hypothetical protein